MKRLMALMALMTLTACDRVRSGDVQSEREDREYRSAMGDYRSGRFKAAISGFRKAIAKNPANASARFQLACLLQDSTHDYLGAYCCYREYLLQRPDSDKAKLARERLAICELEMAKALCARHGLDGARAMSAELEQTRKRLASAEARVISLEKNLGESVTRMRTLSLERDRLLAVVKGVDAAVSAESAGKRVAREARELLDEEDGSVPARSVAAEVQALRDEEKSEQSTGSSLLPKQEVLAVARKEQKAPADPAPERPKTYVVKDGDTLYAVAKRFYGNISWWKKIRDANKALISMDNRLKVGTTIVLP